MMLRQQMFLTILLEKLNDDRASSVIDDMLKVRNILTNPKNMVLHLALNLDHVTKKLSDPATPWEKFLPDNHVPTHHK